MQRAGRMQKPCCSHKSSGFLGQRRPCLFRQSSKRTQQSFTVRASLTNKGKRFPTGLISVKKIMGEGSYGQVFEVLRLRCFSSLKECLNRRYAGGARWQGGTRTSRAEEGKAKSGGTNPLSWNLYSSLNWHRSTSGMDAQGAEEMAQMEHLLNVYASRAAKGSIADFVGYVEVAEDEATTRLTQGIWLVSHVCP